MRVLDLQREGYFRVRSRVELISFHQAVASGELKVKSFFKRVLTQY